jgi:hypothetical protein
VAATDARYRATIERKSATIGQRRETLIFQINEAETMPLLGIS